MSDANERLNEILISSIEKLDGAVDKGLEFAAEQAPDLIQQLLLWHGVKSAVVTIALVIGIVLISFFYHKVFRWQVSSASSADVIDKGFLAVFYMALVFSFSRGIYASLDWLMILIAPKLYLLEYAASLVK